MFYGSNTWDPVLITAQIVSVQCLFYITLGLLQAITLGPSLGHITISYIFDWSFIHFQNKLGWLNWTTNILNSVAGAAVLAWIVERAKKCLDFGATCYIWHMLFVWWYSGQWPRTAAWWIANSTGFLIMVLLGEWFCVRREMQDIPLSIKTWVSRKESGIIMQPVPTEDPDQLPPKPRLRTTAATMQRPGAAAAAAATAAAATIPGPSVSPQPPAVPGPARQPIILQMANLNNTMSSSSSGPGRKKMVSRPESFTIPKAADGRPGAADRADPEGDNAV